MMQAGLFCCHNGQASITQEIAIKAPQPPFNIIAKWQVKRKNGVGEKLIGFMADNLQVLINEMF
jgi:hypothetical protein